MSELSNNSKVGKSFDLPPEQTCFGAKDCIKYCYAKKGFFVMPVVKAAHQRRLEKSKSDDFVLDMIIDIIENNKSEHFRIHASGDFYNREYLHKWFSICEALPHIKFYAYTKSIPLFTHETLPENFTVIYSYGGHYDHMIDPEKDRHAKIFQTKEDMPKNYIDASKIDLNAITENHRVGLIAH